MAVGYIGIILLAAQSNSDRSVPAVMGLGVVTAGAAGLIGALIGFIFGLPHSGQDFGATDARGAGGQATPDSPNTLVKVVKSAYGPNSNLNQVSDWLTKLIVGAGLVQLGHAPKAFEELAIGLSPGFGGGDVGAQVALAVVLYFSVCGFLQGFVWARLTLPKALRDSDFDSDTNSGVPAVRVSPELLSFADQPTKDASEPQSVKVTNTGGSSVRIHGVSIGGNGGSDFAIKPAVPPEGSKVEPGTSSAFSVTFTPTTTGPRSAVLVFTDDTREATHKIQLFGTGTSKP